MVASDTATRRDSPITGLMAGWYARLTKKDMGEFRKLARRMANHLRPGSDVLEVAPGPGYFAIELARLGDYHISGLDLSADFVRIAKANAHDSRVSVDFRQGNADCMPFEDASFDFLLCRAAFKNFANPAAALAEMHRVLRPGGQALIIDLRNDATIANIDDHLDRMNLGLVNRTLTRLIFRHYLLKRAYSREEFELMAAKSPFHGCQIEPDDIGVEVTLTRAGH